MLLGAEVKNNQRQLIEQIYKKAHLMAEAAKQMDKALKEYENGKPWKFEESTGLFEAMQNPRQDFTSLFMIPMGGRGKNQDDHTEEAENETNTKTFEERARRTSRNS
jgi:hypothetical protein